jgi:hypothetical protein
MKQPFSIAFIKQCRYLKPGLSLNKFALFLFLLNSIHLTLTKTLPLLYHFSNDYICFPHCDYSWYQQAKFHVTKSS